MTPRIFDAPVIAEEDLFNVPGYEPGYGHDINDTKPSKRVRSDSYDLISPRNTSSHKTSRPPSSNSSISASSLIEEAENAAREKRRASTQDDFEGWMERLKLRN
jgi:hypothetical protein